MTKFTNSPNTQQLKQKYNINTINDLNDKAIAIKQKARFIDEVLKTYMQFNDIRTF